MNETDPTTTYPLARQGVFLTIQGEGILFGEPSVFVRLAGCPVNCPECDTDYSLDSRRTARDIAREVLNAAGRAAGWVWITGGESAVFDLLPLVGELRRVGSFRIAVATSGIREVPMGSSYFYGGVDFVSVSPHRVDESWVLRRGDQLNVVPGLNGLKLADLEGVDVSGFSHRFVTPPWYGAGDRMERMRECAEWVQGHPGWRLGLQCHKHWGIA
jgi:organic radical activating enzyme